MFTTAASPVFATATTAYTIDDTTATSVSIAVVTFTDADTADVLTLAMSGADSTYFTFTDNGDGTGNYHSNTKFLLNIFNYFDSWHVLDAHKQFTFDIGAFGVRFNITHTQTSILGALAE